MTRPKDHTVMFLVLTCLAELRSATSGEIADIFPFISRKYVSWTLSRCYRRGLAPRKPYKNGRVRGFIYSFSVKAGEWILYKVSQWKNAQQGNREAEVQPRNESIRPASVGVLTANQRVPAHKDSMSIGVDYWLPTVYELSGRCQSLWRKNCSLMQRCESLEQKCESLGGTGNFAFLAFLRARSEWNAFVYTSYVERRARLERESIQQNAPKPASQYGSSLRRQQEYAFDYFYVGKLQGLEQGLELGKLIGQMIMFIRMQEMFLPILRDYCLRKQKDVEAIQAIRARHTVNRRWWDNLHPGYNTPPLPVQGPARG